VAVIAAVFADVADVFSDVQFASRDP